MSAALVREFIRPAAPKDVHIAVVRSHFEKDFLRPIPLVKQFFHEVILAAQSEANRTLVAFVTGVADHLSLHLDTARSSGTLSSRPGLPELIIVHQIAG